jgi:hypothetical protein
MGRARTPAIEPSTPMEIGRPAVARTEELGSRAWIKSVARVGIGARGVIYLLLAYLAFDIAFHGSSPAQTDAEGAFQEVVRQPAGPLLLSVLAAGTGAYGLWRLVQSITGQPSSDDNTGATKRLGWLAIAILYGGLCVRAIELVSGASTTQGATSNPGPFVARALAWPAGPELVGVVAAGLIIGGVALAIWGFAHDFEKDWHLERLTRTSRAVVKVLAAFGDLARGFLVALVGVYLLSAAVAGRASHTRSVDSALKSLTHDPAGAVLVGVAAAGLACFAAYSFADARLRDL